MLLLHADGIFAELHRQICVTDIAWAELRASDVPPAILERVVETWAFRAQTEFRSIQVMARFLGDVLAAGDPIEVWSSVADAVLGEVRHTALCVGVVEALGRSAHLPDPAELAVPPELAALPAAARALHTGLGMLAVGETLSVALLSDLRARATHPVIRSVIARTLDDEAGHGEFGWNYLRASLARFDDAGLRFARELAMQTVAAVAARADGARAADSVPEDELARFGLLSEAREAAIVAHALANQVRPRLAQLELLP